MKKITIFLISTIFLVSSFGFQPKNASKSTKVYTYYWFTVNFSKGYFNSFYDSDVTFVSGPSPFPPEIDCGSGGPYYCLVGFYADQVDESGEHLYDYWGAQAPQVIEGWRSEP